MTRSHRASLFLLLSVVLLTMIDLGTLAQTGWLKFRSASERHNNTWTEVPRHRVHSISAEMKSEALRLLEDKPFRKLSSGEVARFVPAPRPTEDGLQPFLLRAEENLGTNGAFSVLTNGSSLVVRHTSLARHSSFQKTALVVDMHEAPSNLYVEVSVAE